MCLRLLRLLWVMLLGLGLSIGRVAADATAILEGILPEQCKSLFSKRPIG